MDAIAGLSGVSKATIYKHWADKDALCLEALDRIHGIDREPKKIDSGDLLRDLTDFLNQQPPPELAAARDRLMPHLIAYAARNPAFGKVWRARVMEPGRRMALELIERGIKQGRFPADLDRSLALALLIGPMMYKHIFQKTPHAPEDLAEGVAQAFWRAFAQTPRGKR